MKCPHCGTKTVVFNEYVSIEGENGTGRRLTVCFNLVCRKVGVTQDEKICRVLNCVDVTQIVNPEPEE